MDAATAARIAELKATPRMLIGSDSGTHGGPEEYQLWMEITGEKYASQYFGHSFISRCTIEEAESETKGRIRHFRSNVAEMESLREELRRLTR